MVICLWHQTLACVCHGPHCPECGAPDLRPHLEFHRRERTP